MIDFLVVNCPSALNEVLGRSLLRVLKAVTSIRYLIIKFPIATRIGQVRGKRCDSRECYNRSLELAEKEPELPQAMEVKRISRGLIETNINPYL